MPDKPDLPNPPADDEQEAYTSISFLQMLGIPIPGNSRTIDELIDAMLEQGATQWEPPKDQDAAEDSQDKSSN